jgi:hypothetical protein
MESSAGFQRRTVRSAWWQKRSTGCLVYGTNECSFRDRTPPVWDGRRDGCRCGMRSCVWVWCVLLGKECSVGRRCVLWNAVVVQECRVVETTGDGCGCSVRVVPATLGREEVRIAILDSQSWWSRGGRVGERGLACEESQLLVQTESEFACSMRNGNGWREAGICTPSHPAPYILPLPATPLAW